MAEEAEAVVAEVGDEEDAEEPKFGNWLRQQRELKPWTQLELADKSGVSSQQISNIETGRTRNPQEKTIDRLVAALGVARPDQILAEEAADVTIPGLGELKGFDPFTEDSYPEVKGVYVLYDRTKRPVYVGRATKRPISKRLQEHVEKFWFKRPVVDSAFFLQIDNEELCKQTELVLIRFMRSHLLLNQKGVEAEAPDGDG